LLRSPIGRVRASGIVEGASFLILLFIAMPLKYWANMPEAVSVAGMAHGVLFVLYLLAIAQAFFVRQLTFVNAALGVAAAFVPFGPFLLERRLR